MVTGMCTNAHTSSASAMHVHKRYCTNDHHVHIERVIYPLSQPHLVPRPFHVLLSFSMYAGKTYGYLLSRFYSTCIIIAQLLFQPQQELYSKQLSLSQTIGSAVFCDNPPNPLVVHFPTLRCYNRETTGFLNIIDPLAGPKCLVTCITWTHRANTCTAH